MSVQAAQQQAADEADIGEFLMYLLGWIAVFCFAAQFHLMLRC